MPDIESIIARYGAAIARVAASYEADAALREDMVQEIFLAIHRALPGLQHPDRLVPFVFRIAHNRCVTHVARQVARRRPLPDEVRDDDAASPEAALLADERTRRLLAAIRCLPLPYRQVMTLVLEDISHAEIAEALGLTRTNVAVRVNRAKAQLRELLDDR